MVVALLVWLRIGLVWSIFSSTEIGFVDGPGPLSVRVIEQWGMFESTATLSVRTDEGLFSREWPLECPGFDMDEGELHLVRWVGADRVEVHLPDEEPFGVDLDPATGRPVDACR